MCWNASVSINTYIFGTFASIFAYINGVLSLPSLIFYQIIVSIQLIEYFIWSKTFPNSVLSQLAYIVILVQPIIGIIGLELSKDMTYIKYILLACYLCFATIVMYMYPWSKIDFRSTPGPNGHLAWHWLTFSLPIVIIWVLFLATRMIIYKEFIFLILYLILVVITYVLYNKTHTWGSLWCWASNAMAIVFIYKVFAKEFCKP